MKAHRIADSSSALMTIPALPDLIDTIGTADFSASLFRSTFTWARSDHLTAFLFDANSAPRMILAENAGSGQVASTVADQYCRDYWRHDLANLPLSAKDHAGAPGRWIVHTRASDIPHTDYRRRCYTEIGLDDRISLSETRGGRTLRINFYRGARKPFNDEDIDSVSRAGHLMLALVRRHDEQIARTPDGSLAYFRERLAAIAPVLTARETEVCAAIVFGLTSEGIALELGVGINTVLIYKKRAYARLNISSQNQLMRLILN